MLTKKEVKLAILAELQAIDTCIEFPNLQKYVGKRVGVFRRIVFAMVRVYNYQHKNNFMLTEEIVDEVLLDNEKIIRSLSDFYNSSKYNLSYVLLYREEKEA